MATKKSSWESIARIDSEALNRMTRAELARATRTLGAVANKRINRLEKTGIESPAFESIKQSGGKITTKGKNINQLRAEFARAREFLSMSTSTVSGAREHFSRLEDFLTTKQGKKRKQKTINKQISKWSQLLSKLKQKDPKFAQDNYNVVEETVSDLIKEHPRMSVDKLLQKAEERLTKIYEENEQLRSKTTFRNMSMSSLSNPE